MDKYQTQLNAVEREMRDVFAKAKTITTDAAEAGRAVTDEEEVKLKSFLGEADVLKEKRQEILNAIETRKRVEDAGAAMLITERDSAPEGKSGEFAPAAHRQARSIGEAFVKSEQYKQLVARGFSDERWTSGAIDIDLQGKALLDTPSSSYQITAPDYQAGVLPVLFQRLTVAQLMAQGTTSSNLVRYLREVTATNAADAVAEGGLKPESTLDLDTVDESVKKIATLLPVTEEMLEDGPAIESYINSRLAFFVQAKEESELLYGSGSGAHLSGLVGRIPAANLGMRKAGSNVTDADHIFRAISRVREAFMEPDGIIMHPNDWEGIVLLKDSQNRYLGTGPWPAEQGPTLWGLKVVVTTAVNEAQPVIGAFQAASQIFRKGGLTVEASNSHDTFFAYNKVAIRAEERLALAVYRPEAFATADLGATGVAT